MFDALLSDASQSQSIDDVLTTLNDFFGLLDMKTMGDEVKVLLPDMVMKLLRILRDSESHPKHQESCISILSRIFSCNTSVKLPYGAVLTGEGIFSVIITFMQSRWSIVRLSTLHAISIMETQVSKDVQCVYKLGKEALKDLDVSVRLEAINVISSLVTLSGDFMIKPDEVKLKDDAFASICACVIDTDPAVRAKASLCLGSFKNVPAPLFHQMLSKKPIIMNATQVDGAKTKKRKIVDAYVEGDFVVSGVEDFKSIEQSQCGAVIHGLEDEFEDVRKNMLASLTTICLEHPQEYIVASLEFFIDMLNDEIDQIRLFAVICLNRLAEKFTFKLTKEQIATIIDCLNDSRREFRVETRRFLSAVGFDSTQSIIMIIDAVSEGLEQFPEERESIHEFLRKVGAHSSEYLRNHIVDLVKFDSDKQQYSEPLIIDDGYNNSMVLIAAAKSTNPSILSGLPAAIDNHASFFLSLFQKPPISSEYFQDMSLTYFNALSNPILPFDQISLIMHEIKAYLPKDYVNGQFLEKYAEVRALSTELKALYRINPYQKSIYALCQRLLNNCFILEHFINTSKEQQELPIFINDCKFLSHFCYNTIQLVPSASSNYEIPKKLPECSPLKNDSILGQIQLFNSKVEIYAYPLRTQVRYQTQGSGKSAHSPILILPLSVIKFQVDLVCKDRRPSESLKVKLTLSKYETDLNKVPPPIWNGSFSPRDIDWMADEEGITCKLIVTLPFPEYLPQGVLVARFSSVRCFRGSDLDLAILQSMDEEVSENKISFFFKRHK